MANSDYNTFPEIKRNMKIIERNMLQIGDDKVVKEEKKNSDHQDNGKIIDKLQNSEKDSI
jgi:hypothetical protein